MQFGQDAPSDRLEAATLGGREVIGQGEAREVAQCLGEATKAPLQHDGARREHRRRRLGAHGVHRRGEETLAIRLVGDAICADENDGVASAEAMAQGGVDQRVLVFLRQGAQRVREGRADLSRRKLLAPRYAEASADGLAACDPVGAVPQVALDARLGEAVLVDEGADDLGFVEGGGGMRRPVGAKQPALVRRHIARWLDDDGDEAMAALLPACESLEAIYDLVGAVGRGRDT